MLLSRSRLSRLALACAVAAAPLACQEADPKSSATWIGKLQDNDPKNVVEALSQLRKLKAKDAVTNIVTFLKSDNGDIREAAAYALEEIEDRSAVDPLIDAVDLASTIKGADRANAKIADALGALGDAKGVPALIKLTTSHVQLVQLHAVEALGHLKDPRAVPVLVKFITDEDAPPFITKNAIVALGEMKATDAVPDLDRALLIERKGVSFVLETSFSLLEIGAPAAKSLVAIMGGEDKDFAKWANDHKRIPASYMSKSPVVLGDIGDPSTVPALVKSLTWKDPSGNSVWEDLVHGQAAEALGRMHAAEAAAPISTSLVGVMDANMRAKLALALGQIGDRKVLPKLELAAKDRKASVTARAETLVGVGLLGDEKELPFLEALRKTEGPEALQKKCLAESGSDDATKKACEKLASVWSQALTDETARLQAGKECHTDAACWAKKLKDPAWKVRERAVYELGRAGTPDAAKALLGATQDDKTEIRRAVYIALDWALRTPATHDLVKQSADALAAQYEKDKTSSDLQVVNEDLKRLIWKAKNA